MSSQNRRITSEGIVHHTLTRDEFDLLGYLDGRLYLESAMARFTSWHSSFDPDHPDWSFRVVAQNALAECLYHALQADVEGWKKRDEILVLFMGASLGSIATYFHLRWFKALGLLPKLRISIMDLLDEPLQMTTRGEFDFPQRACRECGFADEVGVAEYKDILSRIETCAGNINGLPLPDRSFDISIAPFVHHHLNIYDKKIACAEMARVSRPGGIISVGDLWFNRESFNVWLGKHVVEQQPYAVESFVTAAEHIGFFRNADVLSRRSEESFYAFCLRAE